MWKSAVHMCSFFRNLIPYPESFRLWILVPGSRLDNLELPPCIRHSEVVLRLLFVRL